MSIKKIICLFFVLCMVCALCNACGGGTSNNGESANKTGTEGKAETGLFSGTGGWKTNPGVILLLESDGTGSILNEMNYQSGQSNLNYPEFLNADITWEESKDTVTITAAEGTYTLQKEKSGNSETLKLEQFIYTRLSEEEQKEYQEKAASAPGSGQPQQKAESDSRNEEILLEEPIELINNENVTIKATRFFREVANEGTEYEFVSAGFEIEVENKTDQYDINVTPRDCSLSDRRVIEFASWNSNSTVAPGKIATMLFVRNNSEDFEDLNALYELEGNLDLSYIYENKSDRNLSGKVAFSIPDAVQDISIAEEAGENRSAYADVFKAISENTWFFNGGEDTILNHITFKENKASLGQVYFDGNGLHDNGTDECPYIISDKEITISAKGGEFSIPYRLSGEDLVLGDGEYLTPAQIEEGLQGYWTCTTHSDFSGKDNSFYLLVDHGTLKSEHASEAIDGTDGEYYYYGPDEGSYTLGMGGFVTQMRHGNSWGFNIIDGKPVMLHYDTVCLPADGFPGQDGYYF